MISFGALLQCDVSAGWWRVGLDTRRVLESEMKYASSGIWMLTGPEPSWSNSMHSFRFQLEIVREWKEDKTKKKEDKIIPKRHWLWQSWDFFFFFSTTRASLVEVELPIVQRESHGSFLSFFTRGEFDWRGMSMSSMNSSSARTHNIDSIAAFAAAVGSCNHFFCREISCPSLEGGVEVKSEQSTRN